MNTSLVAQNLYRGSRPECEADLERLKLAYGIRTIISLETGFGAFWDKLTGHAFDEKGLWGWGSGFQSFPLSNFTPPTHCEVEAVLAEIKAAQALGGVYLHCYAGVDRTGFIVAAFRVLVQFWSPEKAWQEALDMGLHSRYKWWKTAFFEVVK